MTNYDVVIIGAGAAGLMCGIEAAKRGRSVLIVDKADKAGKKILISGGGRCNFTNLYCEADNFISHNSHFCKSALSRYTQWDFIALVEKHGLNWQEKTLGQLFCEQKAGAIVDLLLNKYQQAGGTLQLQSDINTINQSPTESFNLKTTTGDYQGSSLVIATGGPSIPAMGATDFALQIATQFSLKTHNFIAALVPFTFPPAELDDFFKDLSGISIEVNISTANAPNLFKEAILFTHRGISGPAALQISSYWNTHETIHIDLLPEMDLLGIQQWLEQQQQQHPNAELKTILSYQLPKRLANKLSEKYFDNKPMKQLKPNELETIAQQLKHWELTPAGTEGLRTAEVCCGGVDTDELSSKTLQAKSVDGLYFIGECVDVTGHLGGFNFQWAWSSGWCAGQYV